MTAPSSLLDKIWDSHVIARDGGLDLVHIDRSYLTDLSGTLGFEDIVAAGLPVFTPELNTAIPDHVIGSGTTADANSGDRYNRYVTALAELARRAGVRHLGRETGMQGIVHVAALEQGLTLPGLTVICGDSHTSTHGALGALAWGIGSTEVAHSLATQTLWLKKPASARITLAGSLSADVTAKDIILHLIGRLGADWGREHALEFAGPAIADLSIEARATLCNLAVEMGARFAVIAPDARVVDWLRGRPFAPSRENLQQAITHWGTLGSDPGAAFDKEVEADVSTLSPQITWGISPEHTVATDAVVPGGNAKALTYMGIDAAQDLKGLQVDYVFIGSCANSRLEDLRLAANLVRGRRVAAHVTAWVVPGSQQVKRDAEREHLDRVFIDAGFEWREPSCSMCVGVNGDLVPPGKRCVSTSNRNFIGRQGPGARTHLASPLTAAASALAGCIADAGDIRSARL